MNGPSPTRSRSGIALIMAMVILAALMLLGLPFLFSQTAALSGARSFHRAAQAELATDTAARIGAAVAIAATKDSTAVSTAADTTPPLGWSGLIADDLTGLWKNLENADGKKLLDTTAASPFQTVAPGSVRIDLAAFTASPFPRTRAATTGTTADADLHLTSLTITDESGKLDPNSLSPLAWDRLLKAVGIADWDDSETVHSRVYHSQTMTNGTTTSFYPEYDDPDSLGELARALARLRGMLPAGRITDLDQLLLAHTGYDDNMVRTGATSAPEGHASDRNSGKLKHYQDSAPPSPTFGLRRRLTRAELDRLRPYLSLHHPRVGRAPALGTSTITSAGLAATNAALIDLGSVIGYDDSYAGYDDSNSPTSLTNAAKQICFDTPTGYAFAFGSGSHIWSQTGSASPEITTSDLVGQAADHHLKLITYGSGTTATAQAKIFTAGDALFLEAPTPVNLNSADALVLGVLGTTRSGSASTPVTRLGTSNGTAPPLATWTVTTVTGTLTAANLVDPLAFSLRRITADPEWLSGVSSEIPPLTLTSCNLFGIDAASAVTGPDGHGDLRRNRHLVVQAVAQDTPIERRWITQAQMQALVAQRWGSQVETWPVAIGRLTPTTGDASTFADDPETGTPATGTSIRPATLLAAELVPNLSGIALDWRASFGASTKTVAGAIGKNDYSTTTSDAAPATLGGTALATSALSPDGARLDQPLAYKLSLVTASGTTTQTGPLRFLSSSSPELAARHLSLWVRPESDWTSGIVPLVDVRVPTDNLSGVFQAPADAGTTGTITASTALTNRLGLYFDAGAQLFVLVVAPPTIEHTVDTGPLIAWDDPATPDLDERCLGFGYSGSATGTYDLLAPRSLPGGAQDGSAGSSLAGISKAIRANAIVHLWSTKSSNAFFRKGTAHHLEVLLPSTRPGELGLIVDGVAGKDAFTSVTSGSTATVAAFGDYCTLPVLTLKNDLAATTTTVPQKGDDLRISSLELGSLSIHGSSLTAADVLPSRGTVRIGNEFIAYQKIDGTRLINCVRGQRQSTNVRADATSSGSSPRSIVTEAHAAGSPVTPAGYRFTFTHSTMSSTINGTTIQDVGSGLYRGGNTLQGTFGSGDAAANSSYPFRIWAPLVKTTSGSTPSVTAVTNGGSNDLALFANGIVSGSDTIPIDTSLGVLDQFPDHGVVTVGDNTGYFFSYTGKSGNALTGVTLVDNTTWKIVPDQSEFVRSLAGGGYQYSSSSMAERAVFLVSIWSDSTVDPTETGRYPCRYESSGPGLDSSGSLILPNWYNLLQITDANTGRAEWIWYRAIATNLTTGDHFFLTGKKGWFSYASTVIGLNGSLPEQFGNRGMMRTDFAGRIKAGKQAGITLSSTLAASAPIFASGSTLIPVQTALGSFGRLVTTGDVMTILPSGSIGGSSFTPMQLAVRYGAVDGYETNGTDQNRSAFNDVKNEYFAFTTPLPASLTSGTTYQVLCGTCWGPDNDLSGLSGISRFAMPRLDLWTKGFDPASTTAPARLVLAGTDTTNSGSDAVLTAQPFTVDTIAAGSGGPHTPSKTAAISWLDTSGNPNDSIGTGISVLPITVTTDSFTATTTTNNGTTTTTYTDNADGAALFTNPMGLVRINGEVFAYRRSSTQKATLLARGLLGSVAGTHRNGEPAVVLPIGPVAQIAGSGRQGNDGTLTEGDWFRLTASGATLDGTGNGAEAAYHGEKISSPFVLVCAADGTASEVLALCEPLLDRVRYTQSSGTTYQYSGYEYIVTPWMRGLFNSTKQSSWEPLGDGTGANMLRPIVIGWWPRHAPALPSTTSPTWSGWTSDNRNAAMRSRIYGWVGFPHGLVDARFDPGKFPSATPVAVMDVLDPGASQLFSLDVRAMAQGTQWNSSAIATQTVATTAQSAVSLKDAFNHSQFTNAKAAGGAELRVWWRYQSVPVTSGTQAEVLRSVTEAGNSAPAIGPVRLRCLAPTRVLATEAR